MPKEDGQFKKGEGGRPKGAVNKITKTVREKFLEVFNELQEDETHSAALKNWARENPDDFYPLASKLIPTEINATVKKIGKDLEEEKYED